MTLILSQHPFILYLFLDLFYSYLTKVSPELSAFSLFTVYVKTIEWGQMKIDFLNDIWKYNNFPARIVLFYVLTP